MNAARFSLARLGLICLLPTMALADDPPAPPPDAPLPEGFPAPTPPDTIEVKQYPAYRSAWTKGEGMTQRSGDLMFFWLFRHISQRNVEMTAPVINTYLDPEMVIDPSKKGELTMEFLYEHPDQGEPGRGVGPVEVKDFPAMTVVALGLKGEMSPERMAEGVTRLRQWLDEHRDQWVAAGPPRRLGYHGPMTPVPQRLWEVQIPITSPAAPASDPASPPATESNTAASPETGAIEDPRSESGLCSGSRAE
ncbi:heme-binding protein [Tautonia sociabilis]|uniref:SOUL heme-binding protein n=1 Tax=Tautonia sociabilis TaxID=2080755 RepID=A0A432MH84_9BACT|nr:heme-binding protein [Tautonia sociabilis]RUL86305.1 hypothetical protein TsocGM_16380 [Tautonia sociabilis]